MSGHWKHEWIPLDPTAASEKFHGHVPAGWSSPVSYKTTRKMRDQTNRAHVAIGLAKRGSLQSRHTHTELFARAVEAHPKMSTDARISYHIKGMRGALERGDLAHFEGHRNRAESRLMLHARQPAGDLKDTGHGDMGARRSNEWADQWTAAFAVSAERFNKMHGAPGSGHGGQFVSSSGGGGTKTKTASTAKSTKAAPAKTAHNVPHHPVSGPAAPAGGHAARKRQITERIHADEAKITTLEHELHQQEKALHSAAAQAAHAKAQHAASAKAGHHKAAAHHKASHKHHHRRHLSHRQRITQIHAELHKLRTEVKGLRQQAAKL